MSVFLASSVLSFLLCGNVVVALHCHTCRDVDRHTGQSTLECEDSYVRNQTKEHLEVCDTDTGYEARCIKFGGKVETNEQTGANVILDGVSRGCVTFQSSSLPQSKCYHGEEASQWLPSLVPGTEGAALNGLICFCEGTGCNGVDSLQPLLKLVLYSLLIAFFAVV